MKKPAKNEPVPEITPKCEYCKHNEGVDKELGFMYHCKLLGYCVPFGYKKCTAIDQYQYCKAMFIGKGSFAVDKKKYKSLLNKKQENENITD